MPSMSVKVGIRMLAQRVEHVPPAAIAESRPRHATCAKEACENMTIIMFCIKSWMSVSASDASAYNLVLGLADFIPVDVDV